MLLTEKAKTPHKHNTNNNSSSLKLCFPSRRAQTIRMWHFLTITFVDLQSF